MPAPQRATIYGVSVSFHKDINYIQQL